MFLPYALIIDLTGYKPGRFQKPKKNNLIKKQNHDYNFRKTRKRKLLGAILCMDHFN